MAGVLVVGLTALPGLAQESSPQAGEGRFVSARLGRLEQKVKDLQVTIGTLQSFVSTKPGAVLPQEAPAAQGQSSAGDLAPRIDALETQITALTNQIEQMGKQMSALEAKLAAAPMASRRRSRLRRALPSRRPTDRARAPTPPAGMSPDIGDR